MGLFRLLAKFYKRYIKFRGKNAIQRYEAEQNVNATVWFSESEMDLLAESAGNL